MVWGTISTLGPACFALLDANVNAHSYIFTLATHLLPYLDEIPLHRAASVVFQQDNAPAHRAHITTDFLNHNAVTTTAWPPLSPDINPIELLWAAMKRHVAQRRPTRWQHSASESGSPGGRLSPPRSADRCTLGFISASSR